MWHEKVLDKGRVFRKVRDAMNLDFWPAVFCAALVVCFFLALAAALCFRVACQRWRERAEHAEREIHRLAETINRQSLEKSIKSATTFPKEVVGHAESFDSATYGEIYRLVRDPATLVRAIQWKDSMRVEDRMPPGVTVRPFSHIASSTCLGRRNIPPGDYPSVRTSKGEAIVFDGEWIVTYANGTQAVYTDDDFKHSFEKKIL